MQNKVKIRQFEVVIALAEELNYTRAAERVGMSQSGVSRCIQSVELATNTTLFVRNRAGVQLTDTGRAYVEQARLVLVHGDRALQVLKDVATAASSVLRVGASPDIDPVLIDILYAVHLPLYPSLRIKLDSGSSAELAHDLLSAHLDLALITRPDRNPKLTMVTLPETPLYVVLSRNHAAAGSKALTLVDFDGERVILTDRRAHPVLYRQIMERMGIEGCVPRAIDHVSYADEAFAYIEAGGGVAILPKAQALRWTKEGYMARPLHENDLCFDERIASRADNGSKLLSEFNRSYNTIAKRMLQPMQMNFGIDGQVGNPCNN